MISWFIFAAVYIAGLPFVYRRAYLAFATASETFHASMTFRQAKTTEDRVGDALPAGFVAVIWPLTIVAWAVYRTLTPTTPGERKADLDAREREIERMERELGIGRKKDA